jgi:hypothetical protein
VSNPRIESSTVTATITASVQTYFTGKPATTPYPRPTIDAFFMLWWWRKAGAIYRTTVSRRYDEQGKKESVDCFLQMHRVHPMDFAEPRKMKNETQKRENTNPQNTPQILR